MPDSPVVVDWNNLPVGRVRGEHRDPRTRSVRALVVALSREAQARLPLPVEELAIPVRFVHGIRAGEVTLDRSFEAVHGAVQPERGA